jgi:type VI secretion system secreted protein VgrG
MPIIIEENVPHFEFVAGDFGPEDLRVLRFSGTEGISELYRYEIDLAGLDPEVDFSAIVGQDARLTCLDDEGDNWVHGIICRFEQLGRGTEFAGYRARLVPKVWALTLHTQSRIFQNQAVPDIIQDVLDEAGVPADLYEMRVRGSYTSREYCVQYRESDWNFIARLMEEEGIFFFFTQTEDQHVLVMGDDPAVFAPIDGEASLLYREPGFGAPEREAVVSFS